MKRLRTCKKCGWVHFAVSLKFAAAEIDQFNSYFDALTKKEQKDYYGGKKSSLAEYDRCNVCRSDWTEFRPYRRGDCPNGVTMGPIIYEPKRRRRA